MADEKETAVKAASGGVSAAKVGLILGGILLLEVAGIFVWLKFFAGGGPMDNPEGEGGSKVAMVPEEQKPTELLVVEDRFVNSKTGQSVFYDVRIVVVVAQKDQEQVKNLLEAMKAQVTSDIASIIRAARPEHFEQEDNLQTLTRKIQTTLEERMPAVDGESKIREVLIPRMIPIRRSP